MLWGLHKCFDNKKIDSNEQVVYSYDIAMLRYNSNNDYVILKNEKAGKPLSMKGGTGKIP